MPLLSPFTEGCPHEIWAVFRPLVPGLGTLMLNLQALSFQFQWLVFCPVSGAARTIPWKVARLSRGSSTEAAYLFACSLRKACTGRGEEAGSSGRSVQLFLNSECVWPDSKCLEGEGKIKNAACCR